MANLSIHRKKIAMSLLLILGFNISLPLCTYALTSGPAQPEAKGFQVATVSDMVDLESGGMKYNIPLMDIDGYPINLSYQSGSGIDDEASWVGAGWSLNPGTVNRQVRGLPDDYSGDTVETDHYVKPKVTVGGRLTAKTEAFGIAHASGSFTFGIFDDNYTGIGAELGVNAGISLSLPNDGIMTAGLGAGVLSNTQSGVDASVSPYVSMSIKTNMDENQTVNSGLSASFGYNTRSGTKALTLGASFGASAHDETEDGDPESADANYTIGGSTISYNTEPISPTISVPFVSSYGSFSFDVGGAAIGIFGSLGGTGYQNKRSVQNPVNIRQAFGFLYADRGAGNLNAVMDFYREKDNPLIPGIPNIAIPVHTPDMWSFTSQTGSGQFRLYRGGSGAFFDSQESDLTTNSTNGGDLGFGAWAHGGYTHYSQSGKTTSQKWTNNNSYLPNGDFQAVDATKPGNQPVYFRMIGEKNIEDQHADSLLAGTNALQVAINGTTATGGLRTPGNIYGSARVNFSGPFGRTYKRPSRTMISYLTASEAVTGALDTAVKNYAFVDSTMINGLSASPTPTLIHRIDAAHKKHHLSEMTVTDESGKRMVYGIPVYNLSQDEYSFAVDESTRYTDSVGKKINTNLVSVPSGIVSNPAGDPNGVDNYYHKERKPAYGTSFLLSAILSPDYVDKTGNGITDDDLGTAIKFNYSKLGHNFNWRTPYNRAIPNRCLMADPDDDKGSIVFGTKEIWYIQSIETKTKIAYFLTADRADALGAANWQNGGRLTSNTQKCLMQIRLYSKADMSKPIKVVKFQYDYSLCRGVPNSLDSGSTNTLKGGKLTLKRVLFEYGNATKGKYHPYVFTYNTTIPGHTPIYTYQNTDRWGLYKIPTQNAIKLDNEQYPYADQNKTNRDAASALWQLNKITLPTGGTINVTYESGDYSYVQNQKAMNMKPIESFLKDSLQLSDTTRGLTYGVNGIRINMGVDTMPPHGSDQTKWFENTFLNGSQYLYTKVYVNMVTPNDPTANPLPYDVVPTYCQISKVTIKSGGEATIMFNSITAGGVTANPMSICAWQRMKNEYPRYAYPGFNNRIQSQNNSVLAAASAVINAARNLSELREDFYQKAKSRNYDTLVIVKQCYAKIAQSSGFKLGGQARVKKVQINDVWNTTANTHAINASYGQAYSYTTTENYKTISSGVAAYEPSIGNDENPLKQPIPYVQNIKGAINNYFDLETPLGESFYPAPTICYSKVTVNDLDQSGNPSTLTGSIVNEFYTSKDFPVRVTALPLITSPDKKSNYYSLTRSDSDDELCLSQGYGIMLNDMQGKAKATTVYDQAGAVITSTQYYYSSTNNGGVQSLNNKVNVIDPVTQLLTPKVLGQDIDFFTDFREQVSSNVGQAINVGGDIFPLSFFLPFFGLPHFPVNDNDDYKLFRSACAVKVVQQYGILSKVVKTENGSTVTTNNLAYDLVTGDAIVTQTTNEFNQSIYSVNIPAYWAYTRMGAAYQNLGTVVSGLATDSHGQVTTASFKPFLQAGDEILDASSGNHYWVIYNAAYSGGGNSYKLIDRNGNLVAGYAAASLDKVIRSGYRNMLSANTSTIVMLSTPFTQDNHLNLMTTANLAALKVINTSATTYDENWGIGNLCSNATYSMIQNYPYATVDTSRVPGSQINVLQNDSTAVVAYDSTSMPTYTSIHAPSYFKSQALYSQTAIKSNMVKLGSDSVYYIYIDTCINFDPASYYCVGKGTVAEGDINVFVNGFSTGRGSDSITHFELAALKRLSGPHMVTIQMSVINYANYPVSHHDYYKPWAGVEIYKSTLSSLLANHDTTGASITKIFTTAGIKAKNSTLRSSYSGVGLYSYRYTTPTGTPIDACTAINLNPTYSAKILNPYVEGLLGNWRPFQTNVFQVTRSYSFSSGLTNAAITVKKAGYLSSYFPYWYYNSGSKAWLKNTGGTSWVTANTVTLYDKYGQQLENVDALGRYSAAKFDFYGELPSAVASNAMNREIYAASLEDSYFTPGKATGGDSCNIREFVEPTTNLTIKQLATNKTAHSGNYSALLPYDGVTLSTIIDTLHQKVNTYLGTNASNQYTTVTTSGLYPNGFEPYPGKKYLFDAWVRDGRTTDKNVYLTLTYNGINVPLKCKAAVEGWKLVEGTIDLSALGHASSLSISVVPNPGITIYIDDIRLQPFQSMMKTYAYDAGTMRLMAELDENGFATFYEYDDEGLLVRVKKETEKGVMTLKESRSTYRKNIH